MFEFKNLKIQPSIYLKDNLALYIKLIAFIALSIACYIDLTKSENNILEDPLILGSLSMVIATILTILNPKIYYIHTAMFFFIITKIISQITHSKHYDIWGYRKVCCMLNN